MRSSCRSSRRGCWSSGAETWPICRRCSTSEQFRRAAVRRCRSKARLLEVHFAPDEPRHGEPTPIDPQAEAASAGAGGQVRRGALFPARFRQPARRLPRGHSPPSRGPARRTGADAEPAVRLQVPSPEIIYSTANEKSQIAFARLSDVLRPLDGADRRRQPGGQRRAGDRRAAVRGRDAPTWPTTGHRGAAMWSKILPVLLLLWALTGRLLSGRRPVRRREGARHAGNAAEQSRRSAARSSWASC